ncbi:MAG: hypothetical protein KatS3mg089_0868 [Patescibacteria group bacterium]|nr:MAG: hypothetical protein KatS3mg089_0868 [Patescibacteria group bacterium]
MGYILCEKLKVGKKENIFLKLFLKTDLINKYFKVK